MIKKQVRQNNVACLQSDMIEGFPPYTMDGLPIRNHSLCEVMDDDSRSVVATYKLHDGQWYRYVLTGVWPPYPPAPEPPQPLVQYINLGLTVPDMPVFAAEPNPTATVVYVPPTYINQPVLSDPSMPTITENAEV